MFNFNRTETGVLLFIVFFVCLVVLLIPSKNSDMGILESDVKIAYENKVLDENQHAAKVFGKMAVVDKKVSVKELKLVKCDVKNGTQCLVTVKLDTPVYGSVTRQENVRLEKTDVGYKIIGNNWATESSGSKFSLPF